MPIPAFTIDGILPPFVGADPSGPADLMSPYVASPEEVVASFGNSSNRREILSRWLEHREVLRSLGFVGFQWLDGSFLEQKEPNDLDVVIFYAPPASMDDTALLAMAMANPDVFARAEAKARYRLDTFFLRLNGPPVFLIRTASYLLGLFSHQRVTSIWKGMLLVPFDDPAADAQAIAALGVLNASGAP